uniref:Calcium dependent secretion activator 2 n=1 Tax=Pavo cristatus TaxID=9049 RepID=A0A8C9F836_PAVCR
FTHYTVFLKSDRVARMVHSGGCSANDFRDVFKKNIEKRVRSLPEIDGLSKETVLSSWLAKYDAIYRGEEDFCKQPNRMALSAVSELILSKEQLYEMFQQILGIKKLEHQLIYNACQLDNADEQAAQIRRELDGRLQLAEQMARVSGCFRIPKTYLPVRLSRLIHSLCFQFLILKLTRSLFWDWGKQTEVLERYLDTNFTFCNQFLIYGKCSVSIPSRILYLPLEYSGDTVVHQHAAVLCRVEEVVYLCLHITQHLFYYLQVVLYPTSNSSKSPDLHKMIVPKNSQDSDLKIKLAVRMDKPPHMKHCGYLYALGQKVWKRWKKRYFVLVQVSQYTFAMCSYREKKSEPQELMQLEGYTVDYTAPHTGLQGGRMFFNAVKEGDTVIFASDDEQDRILWVQAMYRATGQSYKPVPASQAQKMNPKGGDVSADISPLCKLLSFLCSFGLFSSVKRKKKRLFDDSCFLFKILPDKYGWFSPGQVFVLDEYCARYGVRGCHRHLCYLNELIEHSENGSVIDPTLLHYSFAFCASHVHGNRPDGIGTVSVEEKERFEEIKDRLSSLLENQITCIFLLPSGRLKVLMKDIATPIPAEEVKKVVRKCLEKAALINYTRLTEYAKIEGIKNMQLEKLLSAFAWWPELLAEHAEKFLSLYSVDMDSALEAQPRDSWDSFPLFQLLNNSLRNDTFLCNGKFHKHLQEIFVPMVIRYIDLMESSIAQSIHRGLEQESWQPVKSITNSLPNVALPKVPSLPLNLPQMPSFTTPTWMTSMYESTNGSATSEDLFWKLDALQMFVFDLHWPEPEFAHHLEQRLKLMATDMIEACVKRYSGGHLIRSSYVSHNGPLQLITPFHFIVPPALQFTKCCQYIWKHSNVISAFVKTKYNFLYVLYVMVFLLPFPTTLYPCFMFPQKPGMDLADTYIMFVRQNQDILREKVNEEMYIEKLFDVSNYPHKLCGYHYYTRGNKMHFDDIQQAIKMFFPVDHFFP